MIRRLAIVGCGLVGASFAKALRTGGAVASVVGFDKDAAAAARAQALGIVDDVAPCASAATDDADLVVVATPVGGVGATLAAIAPALRPDAFVTDVGSTKRDVVAAARAALGIAFPRFVPGHPVAGSERRGPEAADADLFRGRRVLLTPGVETDAAALAAVAGAWTACGARVETIAADLHDAAMSAVSHLPHLLAFAYVASVADAQGKLALAGSGFRDFTRIAASDPALWRDVTLANRDLLLSDLDACRSAIDDVRTWLAAGDGDRLEALFARAAGVRTAWGRADR